jgi:hypothetical protein
MYNETNKLRPNAKMIKLKLKVFTYFSLLTLCVLPIKYLGFSTFYLNIGVMKEATNDPMLIEK